MMSPPATNSSSTARLPDQTNTAARSWRSTTQPAMATEAIAMLLSVHRTAGGARRTEQARGRQTRAVSTARCPSSEPGGRRRIPIPVRSAVTVALLPETGPLSHRSNRQRRRSAPELRLHLLAAEPDDLPHDPNVLSWCRRLPAGPGRDTPINSARWRHAMSIFALAISSGSSNLAFSSICAKRAAAQGNGSIELLLPEGGGRL
jgi:hypothetical protein